MSVQVTLTPLIANKDEATITEFARRMHPEMEPSEGVHALLNTFAAMFYADVIIDLELERDAKQQNLE